MIPLLLGSVGLAIGGPMGGALGLAAPLVRRRVRGRRATEPPPVTLTVLLLLISIRSGLSVLAALEEVATSMPSHANLAVVARVARVAGLTAAIPYADEELRTVVAQLSRAQRSGASLGGTLHRILETRLAAERSEKIASARSLPVRLMLPVTLLMLPGMILMLYAPSLLNMFDDLTGLFR